MTIEYLDLADFIGMVTAVVTGNPSGNVLLVADDFAPLAPPERSAR